MTEPTDAMIRAGVAVAWPNLKQNYDVPVRRDRVPFAYMVALIKAVLAAQKPA